MFSVVNLRLSRFKYIFMTFGKNQPDTLLY